MKVIDLFAGAGGLSEGFRREGYDIIAHVEMDESASYTLKTREAFYYLNAHDKLDVYKDYLLGRITRDEFYQSIPEDILSRVINSEISDDTISGIFKKVDNLLGDDSVRMIIGGPPCQAYSVAGRSRDPERMQNDPRNFLYKQYIKFLVKYQPELFVFENVSGILSASNGEIFENIQKEMNDAGYILDYKILNAKDYGTLQSRKRVILIGWRSEIKYTYPQFEKLELNDTIRDLFEDLPDLQAGECIPPGEFYQDIDQESYVMRYLRYDNWNLLTHHIARPNKQRDLDIYRLCVQHWNDYGTKLKYNELPNDLITHNNVNSFLDRFNIVPFDGISHTVVAHISKDGHHYIHPDMNQNRSITVREAARIQSFPDNYYFETSRTAAFKQIGNAVPPLMAQQIAKKIKIDFFGE